MNMKMLLLFVVIGSTFTVSARAQKINSKDLIGFWDQSEGKNPPSIEFVDATRVRYSYKGHIGTTKDYYYLVNDSLSPALLTVDYSAKHNKHRNEYLMELTSPDTMKLQVLYKKDSRTHFSDDTGHKPILLVRRKTE